MAHSNRKPVNVNPTSINPVSINPANLEKLAMKDAISHMLEDAEIVSHVDSVKDASAILDSVGIHVIEANAEAIANVIANAPDVKGLDIKTAFVSIATYLLIDSKENGVSVETVISNMEKYGFKFPEITEGEKTPKGKKFAGCKTEKSANVLWKFLTNDLRNKSTVYFATGVRKGMALYYTENRIFSALPLPSDSINAWKEAVKLLNTASGK